jgi:putative transcriptional regulator
VDSDESGGALSEAVSVNVRELRQAAGLSQQQLADQIGRTRASVSALEGGNRKPPIDLLPALCRALHCSIVDLLAGVPEADIEVLLQPRPALPPDEEMVARVVNERLAAAFQAAQDALRR